MQCPNCGNQNRPNVNFCEQCGTSLTAANTTRVVIANQQSRSLMDNFVSCLNVSLAFLCIGIIVIGVLVFFCILDFPSAPSSSFLPSPILGVWNRIDAWQTQNCGKAVDQSPGTGTQPGDRNGSGAGEPAKEKTVGEPEKATTGTDGCTNIAKFVSETIPDHTVFEPGAQRAKEWTVRNSGTCTWTSEYTLQFTQGNRMTGVHSTSIFEWAFEEAKPGEVVTLGTGFVAPDDPGTYTGRWEIFDPQGKSFGWYSLVIDVVEQGGSPKGVKVATVIAPAIVQKCNGFEVQFKGFAPNDVIQFGYKLLNDPGPIPNLGNEYANANGETAIWIDPLADRGQYVVRGLSSTYEGSAVFIIEGENDCPCGEVCIEF